MTWLQITISQTDMACAEGLYIRISQLHSYLVNVLLFIVYLTRSDRDGDATFTQQ